MLLNKGQMPASNLRTGGGLVLRFLSDDRAGERDCHRLISEEKFTEYALRNHLPAEWDDTEDSVFNKTWGGNGFQGLDHHMGHSLVGAVSKLAVVAGSPRDMFDLTRPKHGEVGTHLYWRG